MAKKTAKMTNSTVCGVKHEVEIIAMVSPIDSTLYGAGAHVKQESEPQYKQPWDPRDESEHRRSKYRYDEEDEEND